MRVVPSVVCFTAASIQFTSSSRGSTEGYHAPQDFEFVCAAECTPSMVRARRTLVLAFAFMASTAGHPFANLIRSACDASHVVNATSALGSFPMSTRTPDFVSSRIKRDGFWEIRHPDEMMRLADSVAPRGDGVFIDIGANIGWYSFLFAQFGYKVYAIEAMPANQKAIQATMCLNPQLAQKITLIPSAIGTGERCLLRTFHRGDSNGELLCGDHVDCLQCGARRCPGPRICESVPSETLDAILSKHIPILQASHARPVVVKVDIGLPHSSPQPPFSLHPNPKLAGGHRELGVRRV